MTDYSGRIKELMAKPVLTEAETHQVAAALMAQPCEHNFDDGLKRRKGSHSKKGPQPAAAAVAAKPLDPRADRLLKKPLDTLTNAEVVTAAEAVMASRGMKSPYLLQRKPAHREAWRWDAETVLLLLILAVVAVAILVRY